MAQPAGRARSLRQHLPVLGLLLAAVVLRLWGIGWGLPDQNRLFSYHPDEGVNLVNAVLEDGRRARPHLDIGFYNYGSFYFYLWQAGLAVNQTYGLIRLPDGGAPNPSAESVAAMLLVGRLIAALLGALTVLPVYLLGERLFGRKTGLIAAGAYAVMPAAVIHAHFATVDAPATFLAAVALACGARLLERQDSRTIVCSGLLSGLAAATKYNAGLVLLAPAAALLLGSKRAEQRTRWAPGLLAVSAAVGFLLGCPGVVLAWPKFWADFTFELQKSRVGMGLLFAETGPGWLYHLRLSLGYGLGAPLQVLVLAAVVFALVRHTRQDLYLLAFAVPFFVVLSLAQVRFLRYTLPLLPVLAVMAGRLLAEPWPRWPNVGRALAAAGGFVALAVLIYCVSLVRVMTAEDARDQAAAYLRGQARPGSRIAFATTPWFYSPPLAPEFTLPVAGDRRWDAIQALRLPWELRLPARGEEWDMRVLSPEPDFVVVSASESYHAERLRLPSALAFLASLREGYERLVFENRQSIFGVEVDRPERAPEDWLYIFPRVVIYRNTATAGTQGDRM